MALNLRFACLQIGTGGSCIKPTVVLTAMLPLLSDGRILAKWLQKGFAVISSDAGHPTRSASFGVDPQARLDYGYQAVGYLTPMAKALIETAYGKGPDRSYIGGGSNGGRHAMVAAARYGDYYDWVCRLLIPRLPLIQNPAYIRSGAFSNEVNHRH